MQEDTTVNQDTNGNNGNPSGEGRPQYTETETQLYNRLKKEEEKVRSLEAKLGEKAPTQSQPTNTPDSEWRERMELIARGYKEESDLDFIMKMGGKKALEDEYVKMALDRKQEDKRATDTVAMNVSSKSAIERKYSTDEIRSMSASDMEKVLSGQKI